MEQQQSVVQAERDQLLQLLDHLLPAVAVVAVELWAVAQQEQVELAVAAQQVQLGEIILELLVLPTQAVAVVVLVIKPQMPTAVMVVQVLLFLNILIVAQLQLEQV
jgi:hypothetical protein